MASRGIRRLGTGRHATVDRWGGGGLKIAAHPTGTLYNRHSTVAVTCRWAGYIQYRTVPRTCLGTYTDMTIYIVECFSTRLPTLHRYTDLCNRFCAQCADYKVTSLLHLCRAGAEAASKDSFPNSHYR